MFNTISPKVYKRIRERKGLSQTELGDELGVTRFTVSNFENGKSKPSAELEDLILEVCGCSVPEFAELVREELAELSDSEDREKQGSLLSRANRLLLDATGELSGFMLRGLQRRITQLRVMRVTVDHFKSDLQEHMYECRELLKRQEGTDAMPETCGN